MTNSEEKENTIYQIHREIASLKMKFKYMEERSIHIFSKNVKNLRAMMKASLEAATKRGPGEVTNSLCISPY